jgi:hypothetical protein
MGSVKGTGYQGGLDPSKQAGGAAGEASPAKGRSMNESGAFAEMSPATQTQFDFKKVMEHGAAMAAKAHEQWQNPIDYAKIDWKEYDQQMGLGNADQKTLASKENEVYGKSEQGLIAFSSNAANATVEADMQQRENEEKEGAYYG